MELTGKFKEYGAALSHLAYACGIKPEEVEAQAKTWFATAERLARETKQPVDELLDGLFSLSIRPGVKTVGGVNRAKSCG